MGQPRGVKMNRDDLMKIYLKDKRRKVALRKACEGTKMDVNTKDLYLTVLDEVEDAISRLEGDLYVSERDPEFKNLKSIYEKLIDIKFSIENAVYNDPVQVEERKNELYMRLKATLSSKYGSIS